MKVIDSYERFMRNFNIGKDDFYKFGINETILPPIDLVRKNWEDLKKRVFNNGSVKIRGYGRDAKGTELYIGLYKHVFNNYNVTKDPTNNAEPLRIITELTGYKRNKNLFNYQVSHIFGKTKNILLFEAPWNVAFIPKLYDPFTGHEAKGIWPEEYQDRFLSYICIEYKEFIDEYNQIILEAKILSKVSEYILNCKRQAGPDLSTDLKK